MPIKKRYLGVILWVFSMTVQAAACNSVSVQVLGSGRPELNDQRASSSYLVNIDHRARVLLDVGTGSYLNFERTHQRFADIQAILLSHLHTDHSAGLPAYIKGSFFSQRKEDLTIIGPHGNQRVPSTTTFLSRLFGQQGAFSYLSDYMTPGKAAYYVKGINSHNSSVDEEITRFRFDHFTAQAMTVKHGPIPAIAWQLNINGCRLVYLGDTSDDVTKLAAFAEGADLLIIHNAVPEHAGRNAKHLHITPNQIAEIVKRSQANTVLVSHFMNRTQNGIALLQQTLQQVTKGNVLMAEDLLTISLAP